MAVSILKQRNIFLENILIMFVTLSQTKRLPAWTLIINLLVKLDQTVQLKLGRSGSFRFPDVTSQEFQLYF